MVRIKQSLGAILHVWRVDRWAARWRCHGSVMCCQYVDLPSCNGAGHYLPPLPF